MSLPDGNSSQVIVIGSSEYADVERLPNIPEVARNVEDLAGLLTDPDYGIVPPENCTILLDERELPRLGRQIQTAAEKAEDLLLVYFSGHAVKAGRRHELYLALHETDVLNPDFGGLKYAALRDVVLDSPAVSKVIILDCCFANRAAGEELGAASESTLGELEIEGSYLLTSSPHDRVSLVLPGEEYTAFTGRLLAALRTGIPGDRELITLSQLHRHLLTTMKRQGLPEPQKRGTRTVEGLAIARNRAYTSVVLSVLRERYEAAERLARNGEWGRARSDLTEIADEQAKILGDRHQEVLQTRQLLAQATGAAGNPRQASFLLRELLTLQTAGSAHDSPEVMRTRQFLAVNLGEAGSRSESVSLLRLLLPDRRRVLGQGHPDTLKTQRLLARNLAVLGARAEAEALLQELISAGEASGVERSIVDGSRRDLELLTRQIDVTVRAVQPRG